MSAHFVSATCGGERCGFRIGASPCGAPATHKVGEEISFDDPNQNRHNLTQYVCCEHFRAIAGPAAPCAPPESLTEALGRLLGEAKLTLVFGLTPEKRAVVTQRLTEGVAWADIGREVGWEPETLQRWYEAGSGGEEKARTAAEAGCDAMTECGTCGEDDHVGPCPLSKRSCGHHCNCSWTQDACCWCGAAVNEAGEWQPSPVEVARGAGLSLVGCVFTGALEIGPCPPRCRDHEGAADVLCRLGWAERLRDGRVSLTEKGRWAAPFLARAEEVSRGF